MKRILIYFSVILSVSRAFCIVSYNGSNELYLDITQTQMFQSTPKGSLDTMVGEVIPEMTIFSNQSDVSWGIFNFIDYIFTYSLPQLTSLGVNPVIDNPGNNFVFSVIYKSPYNDAPKPEYPKLVLKRDDTPLAGSPYNMTQIPGGSFLTGMTYSCTVQLYVASNNYTYYFIAYDTFNYYAETNISSNPVVHNIPIFTNLSISSTAGTLLSTFTYSVTYTNIDNFAPVPGDPKLHILRNSTEILVDSMVYVSGLFNTGALYRYSVYGLTKSTYSYYITAQDTLGYTTTSQIFTNPIINDTPSQLFWTGETNYIYNGIYPNADVTNSTFTFRIKYTDIDNDPPAVGYPKVHILNNNIELLNDLMIYTTGQYNTGAIYFYSISFSTPSKNLSYYFDVVSSGTLSHILSSSSTFSVFRQPGFALNNSKIQDGQVITSADVLLSWNSTSLDVSDLTYYLYVSVPYSYDYQQSPTMNLLYSGTDTSYLLHSLESGKKYYWRVDIGYGNGFVLTGPVYSLKTLSISDPNKVFNYPNPFNPLRQSTNIIFYSNSNTDVIVSVYNEQGQLLFEDTSPARTGSNTYAYNGKDRNGNSLLNGSYVVTVKNGSNFNKCILLVVK